MVNVALVFPSYEPQTPDVVADEVSSVPWLDGPLDPSVGLVVKVLVVLTGSWTPFERSREVPFVFGGSGS